MEDVEGHLCASCSLSQQCPKANRFQEVRELCERHLDEIVKEIESRPKDEQNEQYTLQIICGPNVVACPYYSQQILH